MWTNIVNYMNAQWADYGTLDIVALAIGIYLFFYAAHEIIHLFYLRRESAERLHDLDESMIESFGDDPSIY